MVKLGLVVVAVLLDLVMGCGSVELAPADAAGLDLVAPDLGAELAPADAAGLDLVAPHDAAGLDLVAPPARCNLNGAGAAVTEACSSSCAACHWQNWLEPAPDGCALASGVICRPDCASCT
jgi:hypothetical protein